MAYAAPIISALAGVASVAVAASNKPKIPKPPAVLPLPDEAGKATKLRLAQVEAADKARRGMGSTLVGGQMGDASAPSITAPLVLGRVTP